MINRILYNVVFDNNWGRQMRFIVGPRQSGKTTLAKQKLSEEKCESLYYLWDLRSVRNSYKQNELFFTDNNLPVPGRKKWVCFDEIHKYPQWKNVLKGIFDQTQNAFNFIITGSAKLNIIKKAGDSLAGRYFTFHLYPLILAETLYAKKKLFPTLYASATDFIENKLSNNVVKSSNEQINLLLELVQCKT